MLIALALVLTLLFSLLLTRWYLLHRKLRPFKEELKRLEVKRLMILDDKHHVDWKEYFAVKCQIDQAREQMRRLR